MDTQYTVFKATHPDGSVFFGLTTKKLKDAITQYRYSFYGSGGHTSNTGLSWYAQKTNTNPIEWDYEEIAIHYDKFTALEIKRSMIMAHPECLNIKYNNFRRINNEREEEH